MVHIYNELIKKMRCYRAWLMRRELSLKICLFVR